MVPLELVAACRRGEQAEDIVHESYLRMFRSMEGVREEAQLETWMHRILTNVAITADEM